MLKYKFHLLSLIALVLGASSVSAAENASAQQQQQDNHLHVRLHNPTEVLSCPTLREANEAALIVMENIKLLNEGGNRYHDVSQETKLHWINTDGVKWSLIGGFLPGKNYNALGLLSARIADTSSPIDQKTSLLCSYFFEELAEQNPTKTFFLMNRDIPDQEGAFNIDPTQCAGADPFQSSPVHSDVSKDPMYKETTFKSISLSQETDPAKAALLISSTDLSWALPDGFKIQCEKTFNPARRSSLLQREYEKDFDSEDYE